MNKNVFNFTKHSETVDKTIKQNFSISYMSNAKWKKVFKNLDAIDQEEPFLQVIWKFIDNEYEHRHQLPFVSSLEDKYIDDYFWFGPLYYKEIEYIMFPKLHVPYEREQYPSLHKEQNIEKVKEQLNNIGEFKIKETEVGFKLLGHERKR